MARRIAAVVFSLGCVQASSVLALGLGEMTLGSYLNEPLRAQVELLNVGSLHEDQIRVRLATSDDFKRMGVDRAYFLTSISFDVEIDDDGRARIVLTSEDPVLEPYLDFIVEARWPSGRLLREYTVLVDPPVFDQAQPVISASSRVAEVDDEPAPAKKKQQAVVETTGTRVDIRNSQLAPGEMPARDFNAGASPAPAAGARYMIHRDDTLWRIASQARPPGTSVNQTMLDIQRLNPDAFIDGNINLIKAGYIIYLPTAAEISSVDSSRAQAEVSQQNQAWREDRTAEPDYGSGPSLRISAEPAEDPAQGAADAGQVAAKAAALEEVEKIALERAELEQRLASMEQQVETLQRIVSLKDDQIAALQSVLAENREAEDGTLPAAETAGTEAATGEQTEPAAGEAPPGTEVAAAEDEGEAAAPQPVPGNTAPATPKSTPVKPKAPAPAAAESFSNLWFGLVAVVLAVLGLIYMRRRRQEADDEELLADMAGDEDVIADSELADQAPGFEDTAELPQVEDPEEKTARPVAASRGYGEYKHDEYASDEASDALAEAEIYIAYGRYPQAVDLLKNALVNDPDKTSYRLKLLQLYVEMGNRTAAMHEFAEIESQGNEATIAAARAALQSDGGQLAQRNDFADADAEAEAQLLTDMDEPLETDFSGLEIEEPEGVPLEDELDLSADFDGADLAGGSLGEELVIAAESNGLSTKLDLARAYMDMGDDDGARQILEEVAAEGNAQLQAEAHALLERIG